MPGAELAPFVVPLVAPPAAPFVAAPFDPRCEIEACRGRVFCTLTESITRGLIRGPDFRGASAGKMDPRREADGAQTGG